MNNFLPSQPRVPLKAALIGPNRKREGTGPFVASYLLQQQVVIIGVLSNHPHTAETAARGIGRRQGYPCQAFHSPEKFYAHLQPDIVAVCSPAETHESLVRNALERGCDVFCEKPLVFLEPSHRPIIAAEALVRKAGELGLILHHNTQWPYTIPWFEELHGTIDRASIRSLRVELAPNAFNSEAMLVEAVCHANSLLLALGGSAQPNRIVIDRPHNSPENLSVHFWVEGAAGQEIEVFYEFQRKPEQPRPAAYAINGWRVDRQIEMKGYQIALAAQGKKVYLEDPLKQSVSAFLDKVMHRRFEGIMLSDISIIENIRLAIALLRAL